MRSILKAFARKFAALFGKSDFGNADGYVNFGAYAEHIADYRARGAVIGDKVRLLGRIDGVNPHLVSIGDYAVIGANSALLAHCPINGAMAVSVGRFSYIAYGALILPGVSVGDFCIVGAGAVVTKSVPDGAIVAGNPARLLRYLSDEERAQLERTLVDEKIFGQNPAPTE